MKVLVNSMVMLAALVAQAAAEPRYDKKIDEAAAAIVASKMGVLRGGFVDDKAQVTVEPPAPTLPDWTVRSDPARTGSILFLGIAADVDPQPRKGGAPRKPRIILNW